MTDVLSRIKQPRPYAGNAMHIPRAAQLKARSLCWQFNHCDPADVARQHDVLMRLFGTYHGSVYLMPEFHCDFGFTGCGAGLCRSSARPRAAQERGL